MVRVTSDQARFAKDEPVVVQHAANRAQGRYQLFGHRDVDLGWSEIAARMVACTNLIAATRV